MVGNGPNNIRRWRPALTKPAPEDQNHILSSDLSRSQEKITQIIHTLQETPRKEWFSVVTKPPSPHLGFSLLSIIASYRWELQVFVGRKHINREKCTQCRQCADVICPSGAITMLASGYPTVDESRCHGCMGCINLCPTLAISTSSSRNKQPFTTYRTHLTS